MKDEQAHSWIDPSRVVDRRINNSDPYNSRPALDEYPGRRNQDQIRDINTRIDDEIRPHAGSGPQRSCNALPR